jgi:hypothetical protein
MKRFAPACFCSLFAIGVVAQAEFASAATITQPTGANYRPTQSAACGAFTCTTTLDPLTVANLGAATNANTAALQGVFNAEYTNITYNFSNALDATLNWNVTSYQAINDGANSGANFRVNINMPNPLPAAVGGGTYHWVQWVTDNWNITGYDPGPGNPQGIGRHESTIDGTAEAKSPFYDVAFGWPMPTFGDQPTRGEPTQAVPVLNWDAWLYLVSSRTDPNNANNVQVTFYDGIEWGWQATITPIPPALPLFASALGAGGFLAWRRRKRGAAPA